MAFYKQDIVDVNLETGVIHRSFLNHTIGHKDDDADRFGIRAFRNGEPVDLSGAQCQAVFMAPDGTNIALTSYGTVSGNEAYVTLPQACYNVEGQFCLAIKLVGGGITGTVRIVDGMVDRTGATGAVAPTEAVPTYQEILAVYAQMQEDIADYESVVANQNDQINSLKSALTNERIARIDADSALNSSKIPFPNPPISKYGTSGQILRTLGNGETQWADAGLPTDEQTAEAVSAWLDDHPEATTTVQDGSITKQKLNMDLQLSLAKSWSSVPVLSAKQKMTMRNPRSNCSAQGFAMINDTVFAMAFSEYTDTDHPFVCTFDLEGNMRDKLDVADIGHGNAMYYDEDESALYVTNGAGYVKLLVANDYTLTYDSTVSLTNNCRGIGKSNGVLYYIDKDLNCRTIQGEILYQLTVEPYSAYTAQAYTITEDYILAARSNKNSVTIYDIKTGELINNVLLDTDSFILPTPEIEQIAYYNDRWYVNRNFYFLSKNLNYGVTGDYNYFDVYEISPKKQVSVPNALDERILRNQNIFCDSTGSNIIMDGTETYPFKYIDLAIQYAQYINDGYVIINLQSKAYNEIVTIVNVNKIIMLTAGTVDGIRCIYGNLILMNLTVTDNALDTMEAKYGARYNTVVDFSNVFIRDNNALANISAATSKIVYVNGDGSNHFSSRGANIIQNGNINKSSFARVFYDDIKPGDIAKVAPVAGSKLPYVMEKAIDLYTTTMPNNTFVDLNYTIGNTALIQIFFSDETDGVFYFTNIDSENGNNKKLYTPAGNYVGAIRVKTTQARVIYDANATVTVDRLRFINVL